MFVFKAVVSFTSRNLINLMASLAFFVLPLYLLAGCANDGTDGPITSSQSSATNGKAGLESDHAPTPGAPVADDAEDPKIDMILTSTGVTAHLAWDPPSDFDITGYDVYYKKRSSEESIPEVSEATGCSDGESQTVDAPRATITGLEPDTEYFFVIRAFNKTESFCSNEIMTVTPPIQS